MNYILWNDLSIVCHHALYKHTRKIQGNEKFCQSIQFEVFKFIMIMGLVKTVFYVESLILIWRSSH